MNKLEIFKKKLIYRSNYRGTKEMDILLSGFVKKHIDLFDEDQLKQLDKFLDFEDEVLSNYYYRNIVDKNIIRVINFDDENLSLSLKQKLVFDKISVIFTNFDNICRVLLPLIFIIYISVLMSYEK